MKKLLGIVALMFAMTLPALAQWQQNRMSSDDQRKFDSYYSHWMDARQKNDRGEIVSAEKRMQNLMARYNIPQDMPYERVASNRGGYDNVNRNRDDDRGGNYNRDGDRDAGDGRRGNYNRGQRMSSDDQHKFDSYYSHWIDARRKNDGDEIASAEKRMQTLMARYGISQDVPYDRLASNGR